MEWGFLQIKNNFFLLKSIKYFVIILSKSGYFSKEFLIFQNFKRLLPKIKNVFILTGVNDLALAAEEKSLFYPEFGGLYAEDMRFHQFWAQYLSFDSRKWQIGKNKFFLTIDYLCNNFSLFRYIFSFFLY